MLGSKTIDDITAGGDQSNGGKLPGIAVNKSKFEGIGSNYGFNDADIKFPQQVVGVPFAQKEDIAEREEVGRVTVIYLPMSNYLKYVGPLSGVKYGRVAESVDVREEL